MNTPVSVIPNDWVGLSVGSTKLSLICSSFVLQINLGSEFKAHPFGPLCSGLIYYTGL